MAKESMVQRNLKIERLIKKHHSKRRELKEQIRTATDSESMQIAQDKLAKLPKKSSPTRLNTRCAQCGRPHAVYQKFNLCRICLRNLLMTGNIPGGRKSSW